MALDPEQMHRARIRTGVFIGSYQVIALAVDPWCMALLHRIWSRTVR